VLMPAKYAPAARRSAAKEASWEQICAAYQAVIRYGLADPSRAIALETYAKAHEDTLARMLRDPYYGGWTGPRMTGLRAYEERVLGTTTIRTAHLGEQLTGEAGAVERDADCALMRVLGFGADLSRMRPNGLNASELRILLAGLPEVEAALQRFKRDARARLKGGVA